MHVLQATADGEKIILRQQLHWGVFIPPVLTVIIPTVPAAFMILSAIRLMASLGAVHHVWLYWYLLVIPALPGMLFFLAASFAYWKSGVTLTNQRLFFKTGFVSRRSGEIALRNIEAIFLVEPVLGRLFGYGTVYVTGKGGTPFALAYMPDAKLLHLELQRATRPLQDRASQQVNHPTPPAPSDDSRYMPK